MPQDPKKPDQFGPGLRDLTSELERMDEAVRRQGRDEDATMFDDDTHPKAYKGLQDPTEPVADSDGRMADLMSDTPPADQEDVDTGADPLLDRVDLQDSTPTVDITESDFEL